MRNATRGLITVCAGLVAGAAFGATPALAGPSWVPPGHILGYYGSPSACSSYASSLVLWEDDYDCDYRPHRVAMPYALVIQRPVLIAQPGFDHDDDYREPARPAPVMEEPATDPAPAPVVREPSGSAQSDKPAKNKSHKKIKSHKGNKQGNAMANQSPIIANESPIVANESPVMDRDDDCPSAVTLASPCTDILAVPAAVTPVVVAPIRPIVPIVPIVHHRPYVGPWHHPWPL